jgi:phospholipid transport system substrate-binding protein
VLSSFIAASATRAPRVVVRAFVTVSVAVFLLFTVNSGPVRAAQSEAGKASTHFLETLCAQADALIADRSLSREERRRRLGSLLIAGFDLHKLGRYLLAGHWQETSSPDRREFRQLLGSYLMVTFGRHLDKVPQLKLDVVAARHKGETGMAVRSRLDLGKGGAGLYVDWRLHRSGDAWGVVDIVVQGVSMAAVLRSEFVAVIDANGGRVDGLLQKLREKTNSIDIVDGQTASPS